MEILKRGISPEDKVHEVTCSNCKSEIRFKSSEARLHFDRNESVLIINCPVCNKELWSDSK